MNNKPWQNAEGYADPTAYAALNSIEQVELEQQKRVNALIYVLKYIISIAGFDLLNRIEIRDRRTGREGIPMKESPGYWEGWDTTTFIGMDKDGEPRYSPRRYYRCSGCHYGTVVKTKFCPNCGLKMKNGRISDEDK